jgi:hypothetical protein
MGTACVSRYRRWKLSAFDALDVNLWDSKGPANANGERGMPHAGPPSRDTAYACAPREFSGGNELHFDLLSTVGGIL